MHGICQKEQLSKIHFELAAMTVVTDARRHINAYYCYFINSKYCNNWPSSLQAIFLESNGISLEVVNFFTMSYIQGGYHTGVFLI